MNLKSEVGALSWRLPIVEKFGKLIVSVDHWSCYCWQRGRLFTDPTTSEFTIEPGHLSRGAD